MRVRSEAKRSNVTFAGDSTPVLAKHSKSFSLIDCIPVGVDRMQRNFEPMRKQVEAWQSSEVTDSRRQSGHLRGAGEFLNDPFSQSF